MRRVTIIEDSATTRTLLEAVFQSDPRLKVVATYSNAERALKNLDADKADVISMDILLPGMDGLEATTQIMQKRPTPIVVISSTVSGSAVGNSIDALKKGALAVLPKPEGASDDEFDRYGKRVCDQLYSMSRVKVIRQNQRTTASRLSAPSSNKAVSPPKPSASKTHSSGLGVIAIGASTGGPPTIDTILKGLEPEGMPPIVIVQHISPGFVEGLVDWLRKSSGYQVHLAKNGDEMQSGHCYIAPDEKHATVTPSGYLKLRPSVGESIHCPSIDVLFESVARSYGKRAAGVLLTGMGGDGAAGLVKMRKAGAWTVAQDEESCVVYGMPRTAIEMKATSLQLSPSEIAKTLNKNIKLTGTEREHE